MTSLTQF